MFLSYHDNLAIVFKSLNITYGELLQNISGYADHIAAIQTGTRIAVISENRPEWIYAFYAVWKQGGINVPVDFRSTPEEMAYIFDDCQPSMILCSAEVSETVMKAIAKAAVTPAVHIFEKINKTVTSTGDVEYPDFPEDRDAVIIYTSGTTGSPKGALLTFGNLLRSLEMVGNKIKFIDTRDRMLAFLPLHHIYPLGATVLLTLYKGATIVFCPSMDREDLLYTLQNQKVTIIAGIPKIYSMMMQGIHAKINASKIKKAVFFLAGLLGSQKLSQKIFKEVHQRFGGHVKFLLSAGAPLDPVIIKDFFTLGFETIEAYGMTETASLISITRPGKRKAGAAGQVVDHAEVKIVDGEIVVSGPNVMQMYYQRKEETDEIIKDGWLYTGDLGYVDKEGFLFVTGRKKDIIVTPTGKNINPELIEFEIQRQSDLIAELGVFLRKHLLHAAIFPDQEKITQNDIKDLDTFIREKIIAPYNQSVSVYKRISDFTIVGEELPKTKIGKLRRFLLPSFTENQRLTDYIRHQKIEVQHGELTSGQRRDALVQMEFDELSAWLIACIAETKEVDPGVIRMDISFVDLGIDSIEAVDMISRLGKRTGQRLPQTLFWDYPNVKKVCQYVSELCRN